MKIITLPWPQRCALTSLLLIATSPERMRGMGFDPFGPEFRAAMEVLNALKAVGEFDPDVDPWGASLRRAVGS